MRRCQKLTENTLVTGTTHPRTGCAMHLIGSAQMSKWKARCARLIAGRLSPSAHSNTVVRTPNCLQETDYYRYLHFCLLTMTPAGTKSWPSFPFRISSRIANYQIPYAPTSRKCKCNADSVADNPNPSDGLVTCFSLLTSAHIWSSSSHPFNSKPDQSKTLAAPSISSQMNHYDWPSRCYYYHWIGVQPQTYRLLLPKSAKISNIQMQ